MNDNFELENMRQQMGLLKQKLAQQEIVNDALIRQSVKKNVSTVVRNYRLLFILDIIFIPLFYLIFCNYMHQPVWMWLYITVGLLYDAWHRRRIFRLIGDSHLYEQSLLEVRKKVLKVKKYERIFNIISYPLLFLWFVLFFYNEYLIAHYPSVAYTVFCFIFSVVLGFGIGFAYDRRMTKHYQEVLQQIEDVTQSEE